MNREDIIRMARETGSLIELAQEKDLLWLENFAYLVAKQERERIATKIEQLPFGDTAASFSVYVREL